MIGLLCAGLLCAGAFVLACFVLAVIGVGLWLVRQQGGIIRVTSGESELALRDRAEAARTDARRKQEQRRNQVISAAQKEATRVFRRTMGAKPDRVEIRRNDRHRRNERIIWYDGMEIWFCPAASWMSGAGERRAPHMWFLRGQCPDCEVECWSMPIYNLAGFGAMLKVFVPLSVKKGKQLWTDCPAEVWHRCGGKDAPPSPKELAEMKKLSRKSGSAHWIAKYAGVPVSIVEKYQRGDPG